eukprot:scaffold89602_cov54-Phaeocystis_antarctica.AAC.1
MTSGSAVTGTQTDDAIADSKLARCVRQGRENCFLQRTFASSLLLLTSPLTVIFNPEKQREQRRTRTRSDQMGRGKGVALCGSR